METKVGTAPVSARGKVKVALILGTRPEIIKLSPLIRELEKRQVEFFILHTNQHYSVGMDQVFFDELQLPQPGFNLDVHDLPQGAMVGQMLLGIEPVLTKEHPDWVLVEGDTNTVMAGSIAASKLGIKVGHVEAGLRSYDRTMPEELNRIVADHLSDALFCPTEHACMIAKGEGIHKSKIVVTGNTIVDAVQTNLALAKHTQSWDEYANKNYFLLTMHRASNVDTKEALKQAIDSLTYLASHFQLPILYPIHPHTSKSLKQFGITPDPRHLVLMEPVTYLDMLSMMYHAKLIITDSGGIQEEACILQIPCITIRDNTERPETVAVGANLVVGTKKDPLVEGAARMLNKERNWSNPFGDGHASTRIVDHLLSF